MSKIKKLKNFYKNKKILITGHTGFVGSWFSLFMTQLNCKIYGISKYNCNNSKNYKLLNISKAFEKEYFIDINNHINLEKKIKLVKPDVIFHLAAQAYVLEGFNDPLNTFKTNIIGTANVIDSAIKNNIRHNVIITTDKCYVNKEKNINFAESSELGGDDPYSASKACAEIVSNAMSKSFSTKKIYIDTVRAGNIIGGGDFGYKRLITDIFMSIKNKKKIIIRYPKAIRPWQNVLDVIMAYSLIPVYQKNRKSNYESWNLGPSNIEKKITVIDLVKRFLKSFNSKISVKIEKSKIKEKNILMLNSNKIKKKIKWKNQFRIVDTIDQTCNWYKIYLYGNRKKLKQFSLHLIKKTLI